MLQNLIEIGKVAVRARMMTLPLGYSILATFEERYLLSVLVLISILVLEPRVVINHLLMRSLGAFLNDVLA